MKKNISLLTFILLLTNISIGQNKNLQSKTFKTYDVFQKTSEPLETSIVKIATDVETIQINASVLLAIQQDKPTFIKFRILHGNDTLNVKLQKFSLLTENFKVSNQDGALLEYTPGLYYRGIVNENRSALAVFNFFDKSVNGVISIPGQGNRNIGQLENSEKYVIYTDSKMTQKPEFVCSVDTSNLDNLAPQSQNTFEKNASLNCVRIYYEIKHNLYQANASSVEETMNWLTSVQNEVGTLYSDEGIPLAITDVLIWQEPDPYTDTNNLGDFRENSTPFDADLGHLIGLPPPGGGVAYLNSLCEEFNYAYSGVDINFQSLPNYSWTVMVMSHEMGHSLGSPHTHNCFWNGDNTPIDICGPEAGYSEGCDLGPIPNLGGSIMSYCHLNNVGINLAAGFHPQVANHLNTTIGSKQCLGTDCINSCTQTIADIEVFQTDITSLTINIDDVISNSWDYRIYPVNSIPGGFTTTTSNIIELENLTLQPNQYYIVEVINSLCANYEYAGGNATAFFLADDDWCNTLSFTDNGGSSGNYSDNQYFLKTFYPDSPEDKLMFTINAFDLEFNYDFMTLFDGTSTEAPVFDGAELMTGNTLVNTVFEATNPEGSITVEFTSDYIINSPGWDISISCNSLSASEFDQTEVTLFPNPVKDNLSIASKQPLDLVIFYNLRGRVVLQKKLNQEFNLDLSLSHLSSGAYLVKFISIDQSSVIKRIIKK